MKFSKYNIIHTTENQEHILFNSLWGSTFVISPSVKQAIESSNPTLLTEEENRLFIKYNALIPDEYNESCILIHSAFYVFQPVAMVLPYAQLGDRIYIWIFDTVKQDSVLFS